MKKKHISKKQVKYIRAKKRKHIVRERFVPWWIIGGVVGALLFCIYIFFQSASEVKGISTSSQSSFSSSILSFFSQFFQKKTTHGTDSPQKVAASDTIALTALPLGDNKYSSSPKVGYVYSCLTTSRSAQGKSGQQMKSGGQSGSSGSTQGKQGQTGQTGQSGQKIVGANTAGPWINQTAKTWDLTKKVTVDGSVSWSKATWTVSNSGSTRTLSGNGLPIYHTTGVYPISSSDDAYQYDRNPHSISAQTISLRLPTNPTLLTTPECLGGEVGVMLSGVPIYNAFDANLRDAMAWEVQDKCDGHPQQAGQYHYHGYSDCMKDNSSTSLHSDLIGYALDGFGIYGLKGEKGVELSTNDLDECHGHTHTLKWDGVTKSIYHYHMTRDFPYSVSCFRAKAVAKQVSGQSGQSGKSGSGMQGGQRPSGKPSGMQPPMGPQF